MKYIFSIIYCFLKFDKCILLFANVLMVFYLKKKMIYINCFVKYTVNTQLKLHIVEGNSF